MRTIFLLFLLCLRVSAAALPDPQTHFGHHIGADRTALDWAKVVSYFESLAKATPQLQVKEIGKTTEGRPMIVATISSEENMRNLDRYLKIQQRLADPRGLSEDEANRLIGEGKTIVLITCSIHSTEVASTHTAVEYAYKLLNEDTPKHRAILQNTIVLLIPSLNPDGVDIVTQWYRKTLNTPYEGSGPPELYHKYVGHDDNRDWYIFSQVETQHVISQVQNVWHPQIVYDVHQQGAYASRMFVPPWLDPVDPNVDPIIAQLSNSLGTGMAADLTSAGKKGVVINALYDFWTPARHYQAYHGGMRLLSESASARLSSPITVRPEQIGERGLGYNPRERSWNYLEPWLGGEWHLRDIIDYQLIAFESCLNQAAVRREDLLRSFYNVGVRQSSRVEPFAFVAPATQRDPGAAKKLLETLNFGMVEIDKAAAPFTADGKEYPAGSYVIRMQQPYAGFAKTLLEHQQYPDLRLYPGGPPKRPYDVTAQTLPLLMGVDVETIKDRFTAQTSRASAFDFPAGEGLSGSDTESWKKVNAAWKSGAKVYRSTVSGAFYTGNGGAASGKPLRQPRIALYKSFLPSMDEGWTRWLLEQFGFAYSSLTNPELLRGNLRERFDVIVFPDQSAASIDTGFQQGTMPPEYVGGLGENGARILTDFMKAGGRIIFINDSCEYAAEHLGLGVRSVTKGVSNNQFYSPGSLLNVSVTQPGPLTLGMPQSFAIWSENSPAWEVSPGAPFSPVLRYPASGVLASGWLLGEKVLANRAALIDVPVGQGRAILFGMRPQYRAQSYLTFKLFFNALAYVSEK